MNNNIENARNKLRDTVKSLVENRYAQFDAIFVRLMECQMDFYRVGSGLVDEFSPNIDNYRKRYPRGAAPSSPSSSAASDVDYGQNDDDSHRGGNNSDSAATSSSPTASSSSSSLGDNGLPVPPRSSRRRRPDQVDTSYSDDTSQPGSPVHGQPQPAVQESSPHDEMDILNFSYTAAPKSNVKAAPSQSVSASNDDDMFSVFSNQSSQAPSRASASPPAAQNPADDLDLFNFTSSSAKPAASKSPAASSSADLLDDFNFTSSSAPKSQSGKKPAAAPVASADALPFDDIFSGMSASKQSSGVSAAPARPPTNDPKAFRDSYSSFNASGASGESKLEAFIASRQQAKLDELKSQQAAEEKRAADRFALTDSAQDRVARWAGKKNLRALLMSINEIIWPEAGWAPLNMADLMEASGVKRAYRKAMTVVHPDKVAHLGMEQQVLAQKIFEALNNGWNIFQVQEK